MSELKAHSLLFYRGMTHVGPISQRSQKHMVFVLNLAEYGGVFFLLLPSSLSSEFIISHVLF